MDIENCHDRGGTVCNLASCYSLYSADVLTKASDPIKQRRVYFGKLEKTRFNLFSSRNVTIGWLTERDSPIWFAWMTDEKPNKLTLSLWRRIICLCKFTGVDSSTSNSKQINISAYPIKQHENEQTFFFY